MSPGVATYYDLLHVNRSAQPERVRAAYRRLAQQYHPDRRGGDAKAERVMAALNEAYAVLSDPRQRAEYDRRIEIASRPAPLVRIRIEEVRQAAWPWFLLFGTISFSAATLGVALFKSYYH
jgi:curved DNA-binding protein CbpA